MSVDSHQVTQASDGTSPTAVQVELGRMKPNGSDSAAGGSSSRSAWRRQISGDESAGRVDLGRLAVLSVKDTSYSSSSDLIHTSIRSSESFVKPDSRSSVWLDRGCLAATAFTLSNVYKLPTFVYYNYPGQSLIVYVFLMLLVGLPIYVMELSVGQFGRAGVFKLWRAVPLFKGIGVSQLIIGLYMASYFPTLMAWAFQFGVVGLNDWNSCNHSSTRPLDGTSIEEECFQQQVLSSDTGQFNGSMLAALALAAAVATGPSACGSKWAKWAAIISTLCTSALLIASLVLGLVRDWDAALDGIRLLDPTELSAFGRVEVWYGAVVQVLFSLLIGFGTIPSLKRSSSFRNDSIREAIVLWLFHVSAAVLCVLTVFVWVGISGGSVDQGSEQTFVFRVFYHVSKSLTAPVAFAIIFLAGLNALLLVLYALVHNVVANYPALRSRTHRWVTCCVVCFCIWLVNVPGISPAGQSVVLMWDVYAIGSTVLTFTILHLIGWIWLYGGRNLRKDFEFMIERSISSAWLVSWNMVIVLLLAAQLWRFVDLPLDGDREEQHPTWAVAVGWSLYLLPVAVSFVFMMCSMYRQVDYEWHKKVTSSARPARDWGPDDPFHRLVWLKNVHRQVEKFCQPVTPTPQTPTLPPSDRASFSVVRVPYQREYVDNP